MIPSDAAGSPSIAWIAPDCLRGADGDIANASMRGLLQTGRQSVNAPLGLS
jgi:hypothetical protein